MMGEAVPKDDLPNTLSGQAVPEDDLPHVGSSAMPVDPHFNTGTSVMPRSLTGRATELGGAAAGGAAINMAAPYALQAAGAMLFPEAKMIQTVAQMLKAAGPAKLGLSGAAWGAGSDLAEQLTEMMGGGKEAQTIAGLLAPPGVSAAGSLARKVLPAGAAASAPKVVREVTQGGQLLTKQQQEEAFRQAVQQASGEAELGRPYDQTFVAGQLSRRLDELAQRYADQARAKGEQEASAIAGKASAASSATSKARDKVRDIIDSMPAREAQLLEKHFGKPASIEELGDNMRSVAEMRRGGLDAQRMADRNTLWSAVQQAAETRAGTGEHIADTPLGSQVLKQLKTMMEPDATGAMKLTPAEVKEVQRIYDSLAGSEAGEGAATIKSGQSGRDPNRVPQNFESWDTVRRQLRELQKGDKVQGFDAIRGTRAGDIANLIEAAQKGYVPGAFDQFLSTYSKSKGELGQFESSLGTILTGRNPNVRDQFVSPAGNIPGAAFKGGEQFLEAKRLMGATDQQMEQFATQYAANELRGKNRDQAREWVAKNSEWLKLTPNLKAKIEGAYSQEREGFDRLSRVYKSEGKLESKLSLIPGERDAAMAKAREAADKEASKIADEIKGNKYPVARLEELLLSSSNKRAMDPDRPLGGAIRELLKDQRGKELFTQGVRSVLAKEAFPHPGAGQARVLDAFEKTIAPALKDSGAYSPKEIAGLRKMAEDIDSAINLPTVKDSDVTRAITSRLAKDWAGTAIGAAIGTILTAGATGLGPLLKGGMLLGEAAGFMGGSGAFMRYRNRLSDEVAKIMANPELTRLALSGPENANALKAMMWKIGRREVVGGLPAVSAHAIGSQEENNNGNR